MPMHWAPDKARIFISIMSITSPNPMFDNLLESSHRDDSNKWSNIGFGEQITLVVSVEVNFTHLIWNSACISLTAQRQGLTFYQKRTPRYNDHQLCL